MANATSPKKQALALHNMIYNIELRLEIDYLNYIGLFFGIRSFQGFHAFDAGAHLAYHAHAPELPIQ